MSKPSVAHLVCGGPDLWLPKSSDGLIIGVDRGALQLLQRGIHFDVALGDFDSVTRSELEMIEQNVVKMIKLPEEKDVTDCEAAVEYAVENGCTEIYLYGTTGGRLDHLYATTALMLKYAKKGIEIFVEDRLNKIFVLMPSACTPHQIRMMDKKYISFFALEETVSSLTIDHVKYPLTCYDLQVDDTLCVSNEATCKQVIVNFSKGHLLVIQSSD